MGQGGDQKTVDNLFETAKARWEEFVVQIDNIKSRLDGFISHVSGLCETGEQVIDNISLSFPEDSNFPGLRAASLTHKTLATKDKEEIEASIGSLRDKISSLLSIFSTIRTGIAEREELRSQMDYYRQKVAGLHAERDKTKEKGGEQQKQMDRRLRNEAHLNRISHQYELKNKELKRELYTLEAVRLNVLAYLYMDILTVEYMLAQALVANVTSTELDELEHRHDSLSQHPPFRSSDPFDAQQPLDTDITSQPSDMNTVSPSGESQKSVQLPSPLSVPFSLASLDDSSQSHSASMKQASFVPMSGSSNDLSGDENRSGSTEGAPAKKKPPPFIRSRVASGASSIPPALNSSVSNAPIAASAQSTQSHLPRKSLRASLMDIKLPFLQNPPPITTAPTTITTDDFTSTEKKVLQESGAGGGEGGSGVSASGVGGDGVGLLGDMKPSPILSHMKRPKVISPKRRPTKTTFSANPTTAIAHTATATTPTTELELEQQEIPTQQSRPQTPPISTTAPPLPPRNQQPPPMPTSLPPKLY